MSEINPVHTPCKKCVFAVYDNITQTDCSLGYINKYKVKGADILEAYDEEKEFYIVNSKKCVGYREDKWFEQFNLNNAPLKDKVEKYNSLNKLSYIAVVNLQSLNHDQLDDICKQLAECEFQPKKLVLVRYRDDQLSFGYDIIESSIKKHSLSCVWRIQTMLDNTIIYENVVHNLVQHDKSGRFALSVSEYTTDIQHIINSVNNTVHKELDSFIIGGNQNKSAIIYSTSVYRYGVANNEDITQNNDLYQII